VINVSDADMPLYEAMRKWRNARAKEHNIKPFMFFNNKQLETLVREKPANATALRTVLSEMDAHQYEKYQDELLGFLAGAHRDSHSSASSADVTAPADVAEQAS
jgi:ribonuclease D